jgi:hypothetical protein
MTDLFQGVVTILLFFLILGTLVLVHEFGHFLTARLAGIPRLLEAAVGRYGEGADQAPDVEALVALDHEVRGAFATGAAGGPA